MFCLKSKQKYLKTINLFNLIVKNKTTQHHPVNECIKLVKTRDYENYVCCLFLKSSELKRFAFALRAFNSEISCIKDVAKNQETTRFRYQYWITKLENLFDKNFKAQYNDPICYELKQCLKIVDYNLSISWFKKLIECRKNNLNNFPFMTTNDLEKYVDSSNSPIYYLLTEYANNLTKIKNFPKNQVDLDHISNHLGKSQGLINLLRGIYRNALNEECHIPNELLIKYNLSHEDILRLCYQLNKIEKKNQKLDDKLLEKYKFSNVLDLLLEIATLSKSNLDTSISLFNEKKLTNNLTANIFLPIYNQKTYLNQIEKTNFNVFDSSLNQKKVYLPFQLFWFCLGFKKF